VTLITTKTVEIIIVIKKIANNKTVLHYNAACDVFSTNGISLKIFDTLNSFDFDQSSLIISLKCLHISNFIRHRYKCNKDQELVWAAGGRHGRHLESVISYQKSDSMNQCVFT